MELFAKIFSGSIVDVRLGYEYASAGDIVEEQGSSSRNITHQQSISSRYLLKKYIF